VTPHVEDRERDLADERSRERAPDEALGTAAHAEAAGRAAIAALANAIARAAAVRPRALPLDPARLLAAIPPGGTPR